MLTTRIFLLCCFLHVVWSLQVNNNYYRRTERNCKPLQIENGRFRYRSRNSFGQFICNRGYTLVGDRYAKCVRGYWQVETPVCVRIGCPHMRSPDSSFFSKSYGGAMLRAFCMTGYALVGAARLHCNGTHWNAPPPQCISMSTDQTHFNCDFEAENTCGWAQDVNHDFDWTRAEYHVLVNPLHDHTFGVYGTPGHYMHLTITGKPGPNETARLLSPVVKAALSETGEVRTIGIAFYYHLSTSHSNGSTATMPTGPRLRVGILPISNVATQQVELSSAEQSTVSLSDASTIWDSATAHAPHTGAYMWHQACVFTEFKYQYFIIEIEAINQGEFVFSEIAIDDVSIMDATSECYDTYTTVAMEETGTEAVLSCANRCGSDGGLNHQTCDCHDACIDLESCCPDYASWCVVQGDTDDGTTESINTTITFTTTRIVVSEANMTTMIDTDGNFNDNNIPQIDLVTPVSTVNKTSASAVYVLSVPTTATSVEMRQDMVTLPRRVDELEESAPPSPPPPPVAAQTTEQPPPPVTMHYKIDDSRTAGQPADPAGIVTGWMLYLLITMFAMIGVASSTCLVRKYATRCNRAMRARRGAGASHGDSQSDVRFLTSDEILDFNIARPIDDYIGER